MTIKTYQEIKPTELRIGNLVRLRDMDYCNILEVESIKKNHISAHFALEGFDAEDHLWLYDELEPIPVTPELLTTLGWKHKMRNKDFPAVAGNWFNDEESKYPILGDEFIPPTLHYLQNYYYAIHGEELDVTPLLNYYLE